jgi:hypothetical protein
VPSAGSIKKVTVLALNIQGPTQSVRDNKNAIIQDVTALHNELESLVPALKGHIQCSLSGNFVFTFNAATNVTNPTRRGIDGVGGVITKEAWAGECFFSLIGEGCCARAGMPPSEVLKEVAM